MGVKFVVKIAFCVMRILIMLIRVVFVLMGFSKILENAISVMIVVRPVMGNFIIIV